MAGNPHPVFQDGVAVEKANARAYLPVRLGNPDALRALDGSTFWLCYIQTQLAFFYRDTSDTTSEDNGTSVIVDGNGGVWKFISSGAGIAIGAAGPVADRGDFDSEDPGFTYFGTDTELLYVRLTGGGWSDGSTITGADGSPGANGATWLSGSTDPSNGSGSDGDFYFQTGAGSSGVAGDTWKKSSGTWSKQINLKGPAGNDSTVPGPSGTNGTNGASSLTVVRLVATSNVAIASGLENGDTVDGVALVTGDFVLLSAQTAAAENGIYQVVASGAASRATAFNTYDSMPGCYFSVMEGTAGADKLYRCTSNKGGTLGTTALAFSEFTSGGGDVAGDTHAATSKDAPVDADELPLVDSAASNVLKKLTWANLKAALGSVFATAAQGTKADSAIQTLVEGTNITIDATDPQNPVISAAGGAGGGSVDSIVPGANISVDETDPTNPVVSAITRELLSADRDYYVRTDGSDSNNGLANTSGGAFLTVAAALVSAKAIDPNGHKIKINVGEGVFTSTSPNDLTGYFSKDIKIIGAEPVSLSISSFGSATGSERNWTVVINVTDASAVSVGDYAIIRSPTGTGAKEVHAGCWKITASSSTSITLKNTYYGSVFPTNTLTGGELTVLKTVLQFNGCNGLAGGNFGLIDQVAIVGNNTSATIGLIPADVSIDCVSNVSLNLGPNVGVSSFDIGMVAHFGASIHALDVVSSDFATYGLSAQHGGTIFANGATVSGGSNTTHGVMSQYGASIYFEEGLSLGSLRGVQAQLGGNILFKSGTALLCDDAGAAASYNGTIQAEFALLTNNRNAGGIVEDDGVLYLTQSTISANDVNGVFASGGRVVAPTATFSSNGSNSISCTNAGRINAEGANLGSGQVFANKGSWVDIQGATNLGTLNPAANTLGNEQAYIDT